MDLVEKETWSWHEEGTVPSEPFFVARPGATNEDDGQFNTPSIPNYKTFWLYVDC
jgi:carotenoid cleavage dioxygenase-like enzyme